MLSIVLYLRHFEKRVGTNLISTEHSAPTNGSLMFAPLHFPSRQFDEFIFVTNRFTSGIN